MSRLFKFEIKRMKYKKIHIILPLIIISIGLVGIITGNAFNENLTSKVKMLNIFQAYTQFSFIFLGFVYIYLFTEDSIKGTDKYISQLGYSLAVQILFKSLILYAYTLIITTAFIIGYAISIHKSQGGSAKVTITLTPSCHAYMMNSNLLYVALTRTKEKCFHIGDKDTVNRSIKKKENFKRNTFLLDILKKLKIKLNKKESK